MDGYKTSRIVLALSLILISISTVFGQNYQNIEYRRFSLSVNSGASLGDMNTGNYVMSSNFTENVKNTLTFGAGFQYALTPVWSIEAGYRRTSIKGRTVPFKTDMNLMTLKSYINLNQLLYMDLISNRINPFISAGMGYDYYTYDGPDDHFSDGNTSYNLGAGIAFRLTDSIDLFSHYEYHITSNSVDNNIQGVGTDLINSLTAGVRYNFGAKGAVHPSWKPLSINIHENGSGQFDELNARLASLEKRTDQNEIAINDNAVAIDSLKAQMDRLENRMDELERAFTKPAPNTNNNTEKVTHKSGIGTYLPEGHYVQIFATYHLNIAQDVRNYAIQSLKEVLEKSDQEIVIIHRKKFYEVIIGVFPEFNNAKTVQEIMTDVHQDAYVISFPRPMNLMPDFEGLEVLQKKDGN